MGETKTSKVCPLVRESGPRPPNAPGMSCVLHAKLCFVDRLQKVNLKPLGVCFQFSTLASAVSHAPQSRLLHHSLRREQNREVIEAMSHCVCCLQISSVALAALEIVGRAQVLEAVSKLLNHDHFVIRPRPAYLTTTHFSGVRIRSNSSCARYFLRK